MSIREAFCQRSRRRRILLRFWKRWTRIIWKSFLYLAGVTCRISDITIDPINRYREDFFKWCVFYRHVLVDSFEGRCWECKSVAIVIWFVFSVGVYLDMGTFSLHRSDDITFLSKEYYGIVSIKMGCWFLVSAITLFNSWIWL